MKINIYIICMVLIYVGLNVSCTDMSNETLHAEKFKRYQFEVNNNYDVELVIESEVEYVKEYSNNNYTIRPCLMGAIYKIIHDKKHDEVLTNINTNKSTIIDDVKSCMKRIRGMEIKEFDYTIKDMSVINRK